MRNMFKNKLSFYIITLAAYGVVLALFYCSSMYHDPKYNDRDDLVDVAERSSLGTGGEIEGQSGFPYARMMNLIAQARSVEQDFHRCTVGFEEAARFEANDGAAEDYDGRVDQIKKLRTRVLGIGKNLKKEYANFVDYVAEARFLPEKSRVKRRFLCSSGPCPSTNVAHSLKHRRKKTDLYIIQVLKEYIERLGIMDEGLRGFVEKVALREEARKARSINEAQRIKKPDTWPNVTDNVVDGDSLSIQP